MGVKFVILSRWPEIFTLRHSKANRASCADRDLRGYGGMKNDAALPYYLPCYLAAQGINVA